MCTVSMVGDHYNELIPKRYPWMEPVIHPWVVPGQTIVANPPTREEFDALKREVEDMKALLIRAKEYDERNGEPDCEMDEKVALLKQVAKLVGVDLSEVFGKSAE